FAKNLLILQARRAITQALLPLKFGALKLAPMFGNVAANDWKGWHNQQSFDEFGTSNWAFTQPFSEEPAGGAAQSQIYVGTERRPTSLGMQRGWDWGKYKGPKAELVDPLFAPVALEPPTGAALGLPKTTFYLQTWGREGSGSRSCESHEG